MMRPVTPRSVSSLQTTVPLTCGVLGLLGLSFLSPFALILTHGVAAQIQEGAGTESDLTIVKIARVLGAIGSVLLALQIIAFFLFYGLISSQMGIISQMMGEDEGALHAASHARTLKHPPHQPTREIK